MSEYQPLTSKIQVPKEWPVEVARSAVIYLVELAIKRHLLGQRVAVIIGTVSALVTDNEARPGYLLKRIEEINDDDIYKYELIMPIKTRMLSMKPGGPDRRETESVQLLPMSLRFNHPISKLFLTESERHKVMTVVPNMKKISELKSITGPEVYDHILQTVYRVNKIKCLDDMESLKEPEASTSAGTSVSMEQVTSDEWNIVYLDCITPPQRRWCNRKAAITGIICSSFLVLLILFIFLLVLIIQRL